MTTKIKPLSEEQSLAVLNKYLPATPDSLEQSLNAPSNDCLYSQYKILYPVEVKKTSCFKLEQSWFAGLYDGKSFEILKPGYLITLIDARNAVRILEVEGTKKSFNRAVEPVTRAGKVYGRSGDKYNDLRKAEGAEEGNSFICAIIDVEGRTAICEVPLFKTTRSYLFNSLISAKFSQRLGLKVLIDSHFDNTVESKNDNTKTYLSGALFKQKELVELTPQQMSSIAQALETDINTEKYMAWLNS